MLLRLGDTIFTREKPLLWYSNKLSMAEHPARNACRELSETVTLERVSFLRCGKLGALALLAIFAVVSIIREDASFEAGDGESGAEAEHRWRERQRSTPRAKAVEFEEYIELPEAVESSTAGDRSQPSRVAAAVRTTGNSGFAERIRLCRGSFVGPSAELICAECRHRDRFTHGTTIFADGRTVGTARPSASRFLCRGLALGT
jgi:hypothetical protein